MDWSHKLLFTAFFLVVGVTINRARGDAIVTGTVFCDQCKDGQISLFDYPLYGINVTMACPGSDGQYTAIGQETTNWVGNYALRISGTPNLSSCYAQVSNGQGSNACGAASGPPQHLNLIFNMFDTEMYTVDPLLAQPAQPMSFCPAARPPVPPFLEASACPHQKWLMPEFRCYWKVVSPDTKVAVAFGLIAGGRYGSDITLGQGMLGRGDPYRTLLREGITALLNSYNSIQFSYNPVGVVEEMNLALVGSTRRVLRTALSFMKANAGIGTNATCTFTPCN